MGIYLDKFKEEVNSATSPINRESPRKVPKSHEKFGFPEGKARKSEDIWIR
jgi:hypothetical protein